MNIRKFTLSHPLHVDQYGGVVRIVSTTSPFTLKGIQMPVLGYRYQAGTDEVEEHHYTIDGLWDPELGRVTGYDLWDADLESIKPVKGLRTYHDLRVAAKLVPAREPEPEPEDDEDDNQLRWETEIDELAARRDADAEDYAKSALDLEDYEGDPDAPMGPSHYTGRNI